MARSLCRNCGLLWLKLEDDTAYYCPSCTRRDRVRDTAITAVVTGIAALFIIVYFVK